MQLPLIVWWICSVVYISEHCRLKPIQSKLLFLYIIQKNMFYWGDIFRGIGSLYNLWVDSWLALNISVLWKGSQMSFSMFPPTRKMMVTNPISTQEKMKLNPTPLLWRTDRYSQSIHIYMFIYNYIWRCSSIVAGGLEVGFMLCCNE